MGKYIEWDMQQHPDFFKSSPSGKYTDLSIVRHVVSNVNPPDEEQNEAFMKILNAVAEEVNLISALDDVVKVVRCKECKFYTLLGHCLVHSQEPDQYGPGCMVEMLPDAFCSYGERREKREVMKEGTFTLYQIKTGPDFTRFRFMNMDWLRQNGETVRPERYEQQYSATLDSSASDQEALEEIFCRLNERRYDDYDGPSMSVSDVVVLSRDGKKSAWYCDSVGFQEVPEFLEGYHHE